MRSVLTPWPYQVETIRRWAGGGDEVVLKARQIGVSELAAIYAAMTAEWGGMVLILSQGQREARRMLRRCRNILARRLVPLGDLNNVDELSTAAGGGIVALPSTLTAGRSYTAKLVIVDEAAYQPFAAENYAAYRPAMADGGQLIVISTANGPAGWFYDLWLGAPGNGMRRVFLPWHLRPGRDEAWVEKEKAAYPTLAAWRQEYPATPEEAWQVREGLVYGVDADGVPIYLRERNVRTAASTWPECLWRVAGIDPGGDGDPTAMVAVGVDRQRRYHVYDANVIRGASDLEQWQRWIRSLGNIQRVFIGETGGGTLTATIRRYGIPAVKANLDRSRIGDVQRLLRTGWLTISPHLGVEFEDEFYAYYWSDRPGARQWATETLGKGHADRLDALRYAIVGINDAMPAAAAGGSPVLQLGRTLNAIPIRRLFR